MGERQLMLELKILAEAENDMLEIWDITTIFQDSSQDPSPIAAFCPHIL